MMNFVLYFTPVIDTVFVIFAKIVYSYMFSKSIQNRRKDNVLREQIAASEPNGSLTYKLNRF